MCYNKKTSKCSTIKTLKLFYECMKNMLSNCKSVKLFFLDNQKGKFNFIINERKTYLQKN